MILLSAVISVLKQRNYIMTSLAAPSLEKFSATLGQDQDLEAQIPQRTLWQASVNWMSSLASKAAGVAGSFFRVVSAWTKDTDAISGTIDKLQTHVIVWVRHANQIPEHLGKMQKELKNVVGIIDFVLIFNEIKYFVKKKWQDDSSLSVASHVTGLFARACIGLNFLKDLGFLDLGKVAHAIGQSRPLAFLGASLHAVKDWPLLRNIPKLGEFAAKVGDARLFSFVAKVSIERVTLSALMCTFALVGLDAVRTLITNTNAYLQTSAFLSLLSSLGELALVSLAFFGAANPVTLGVVGVSAIIFGLSKYSYDFTYANELNAARKEIKIKA